ncbi:SusC/RagA family TonB-linked outer membrane protein [Daejeonella sp.]|uniref:SusC/RagA family TonB-linked outer membrane protein n=1 Tax=Daejeonella sp. TaxID=2805397 RepID=UPI00272FF026|nr:SusC/RagA family TonB-linked outer membrane protein [Daejeonella sp.]MDP2413519.1 SusC/RagA family TonB-linked outer membrane protein [Daejeonella sp.]
MNSLTNKEYCLDITRSKVCHKSDALDHTEQHQIADNLIKKSLYKQIGRIMKLTFILIMVALMNVYSKGYSQKVTLTGKHAPLEEFFSTIKQQTGYVFFYDLNLLKTAKPVTLKIVDTELSEALAILFNDQPLDYSIENKTIVISEKLSAKDRKSLKNMSFMLMDIRGKVVDSKGETLPGVSVRVKGTAVGTTTDAQGNFVLNAPDNGTLVFSYIGYISQEVTVNSRSTINVTMVEDSQMLGEVVVTALGIERSSKSLNYAAQTVKTADLNQAKETNLINSLAGKVAGVTITKNATGPGSSSNVVLRGQRSVFGSNQPLYVIDGVPMDNTSREVGTGGTHGSRDGGDGIGMLNSDDIESMTILKGASAAALYGSAGQNGAIIITTKRGKSGKITVDYTGNTTVDRPFILPEVQAEYGQGAGGVYNANSETSWGPKITGQSVTLWNGKTTSLQGQPDRIKDFYRDGSSLTNTIGISGGSEKMQTYFSYGNNQAKGILQNHVLDRHNFDFKIDNSITDKLSFFTKLSYIVEDVDNKPFTGERNDATGSIYHAPASIPLSEMQNYEYTDVLGNLRQSYWLPGSIYLSNPYWKMNRQVFYEQKRRMIGLLQAKYKFTNWLDFMVRGSMDRTDENTENIQYNDSYELSGNGSYYELYSGNRRFTNVDALLSFKRDITKDFNLTGYLGGSIQETKYESINTLANGLNKLDFFFMSNAKNPRTTNVVGQTPQVQSVYGTSTLSFKDYLYLDVTARNDWSSALPKANQSYFYPSVGLTAIITDMLDLPSWISYGKLRTTYAKAGFGGQQYLTDNYFSVGAGGAINTPSVRSLGNYQPEITTSFEAGLDWRFFTNRIGLDVTYYRSNTENQLIALAVPNATLFSSQYINAGLIRNSGVEIMLSGAPVRNQNFSWDIMANFSKNVNKVVELSPRLKTAVLGDDRQVLETVEEGKSFGEMYMAEWSKDAQGRRLVSPAGVPILTGKTAYAGNYNPNYMLGVNNSFTFKNLNLSFLLDYRNGGTVVAGTLAAMDVSGNSKSSLQYRETGIVVDGYTTAGVKNTTSITAERYWQSLGNRTPAKDFYAFSATNLRLREVVFGYRIPNQLVQKSGFIKNARLSLVGRNLLFLKKYAPYDPEIATAVTNRGGMEYSSLPTTRNIGLSLNASF